MSYRRRNECITKKMAGLALGLLVAGAAAAEAPPEQGPAREAPGQQAEEIQAPSVPVVEGDVLHVGPMVHATVTTGDPNDKGSSYTDMSDAGGPMALTALEEAKLEMARRAIEASRLAGTLHGPAHPGSAPVTLDQEAEAAKRERLESMAPAVLPPHEAAGVGIDIPPIQETGPAEMNEIEKAKLAGEPLPETETPADQTEDGSTTPAEGDGAPNGKEEN